MAIQEEHGSRGIYDENERLQFNFGRLAQYEAQNSDDPRAVILRRFAVTVFLERNGRDPLPEEDITLRHPDDLAVAAIFGIPYPDITAKVKSYVADLGVIPEPSSDTQT